MLHSTQQNVKENENLNAILQDIELQKKQSKNMTIELKGNIQSKLPSNNGIYTRSYQEARAVLDALVRNWTIDYIDNLYHVQDSKEKIEKVYIDSVIKNCSCSDFIEKQCGTCMHIEAINLIPIYERPKTEQIRPIAFLNKNFELKQIGQGQPLLTPSVRPFVTMQKKHASVTYDREISDNEIDVFTDYGISLYDFQKDSIKSMIKFKKNHFNS